jgi:hypothetical protein
MRRLGVFYSVGDHGLTIGDFISAGRLATFDRKWKGRCTVVAISGNAFEVRPGWWRRNRIKRTRGVWQRFERRIA